ncbi:MAG: hypothetical protein OXM02_04420 [Bacteroidota bacterium]|nr:hypothetical protein [Bacteroidota bacterium]
MNTSGGLPKPQRAVSLMLLLMVFGACAIGSCRSSPDLGRKIESEVMDSLLEAAPQTLIDTDGLAVQTLYPDGIVAEARDSLALGPKFSFTFAQDSLYITDFESSEVFSAGLRGQLERQIGLKGEGPLELNYPWGKAFNGTSLLQNSQCKG